MLVITADLGGILGSPVWTVLATILAAAAIWVSIWLYRRQRTRKSLGYEVKVTELVSVHQAAKGRIKIFFGDEQIQQAHLVEARIENDGNVPVTPDDFQRPITFDLGAGATALTADITEIVPEDLQVQVRLDGGRVELQKLLLNPRDALTIKVFARNLGEVQCHYRIVGVSKMGDAAAQRQRREQSTRLRRIVTQTFDGAILLGAVSVLLTVLAVSGVSSLVLSRDKQTETLVKLKDGKALCGDVLHTGDQRVVVQLAESGRIEPLAVSEVGSINEDAC